jgi:hypothetical protein
MTFAQLRKKCDDFDISATENEIMNVEKDTREQSLTKKWFYFRAGRVTASRMKAACHTDPDNPAKSLIFGICYPEMHKFSTAATRWGCDHEEKGLHDYEDYMSCMHQNFSMSKSGFWINKDYPFIGASPDAMVSCSCCGEGCVEIKCPFCQRDKSILEATGEKFCIDSKSIMLKADHTYFYQVQTQMFTTGRSYCDFIVWTNKEMYMERVSPDQDFWEKIVGKASNFFRKCLLPELVAGYFSSGQSAVSVPTPSPSAPSTAATAGSSSNMERAFVIVVTRRLRRC